MKRVFIILLTLVLLLNISVYIPVSAASDDTIYIPKIVSTGNGNKLVYVPELADIARKMSSNANKLTTGSTVTVAKTMKEEDFQDIQIRENKVEKNGALPEKFLVGVKNFKINGKEKHILAIAFRGTDFSDLDDVVTDALVCDLNGFHAGFYGTACGVFNILYDEINFPSIKDSNGNALTFSKYLELAKDGKEDYYIFVTGHSLGGAVANIFTGDILAGFGVKANAMCYTFGAPTVCSTSKAKSLDAYNVFNIINTKDPVPKVGYNIGKGVRLGKDFEETVSAGILFDNHTIGSAYKTTTALVRNNIEMHYKYTLDYYDEWCKENAVGSNGGGFRGDNGGSGTGSNNPPVNNTPTPTPAPSTPTPSTPPTISFSKSQLNLDYNSHPSETITITASGDLKSYHLNFKFDSALSVTSGQWNGNSISTTIKMKGGPVKDNKVEVYLKDSSGKVCASNTIYVNATVPVVKQNTEIVLSKDNISIHFPDKQYEKMFVTIEGPILDNSTIAIDTNESVTFEWGKWSNNRAELTIQSSRAIPGNYTPSGYATIYLKDGNGNIYATKQFNLTSTIAKYAVRYDANGGYDAPDTHYIYHNHWGESVSSHIPKREGYKFKGWSTSKNGKVEYGPSQQLMKDHDIVFYAVWEKVEDLFSLEFDHHSIHDDTLESVKYCIDGNELSIKDIIFYCDKNIECNWDMVKNEDGSHSVILQINRNGDISSNKLSFNVVDKDGHILFSDTLSVFESYNKKQQFSDRNKDGITVYVDGEKIKFDVQPRLINNRTMVPMRAIFEALGAMVNWDNNTRTAFGETVDDFVEISIGDNYLLRNDEKVYLDSPAIIISGRTLVPVRAIAESLNCNVEWIGDLQVVNITSLGNDYSNDMVVGTWEFIGFIDDFDDIEYYDNEGFRTFKFHSNGTVIITDNNSNSSKTYDYHVTKGGYIVIDLDVNDEVLIGTISPDDELTIRSYYYSENPEDIYWETQNGSVILRKSYNHYGRNLIEDDDGYIFKKVD